MPSWGRLSAKRSLIGFAGELITVLGAIGFAGSIIVNTLVFRHWRLNFIQIASSSDVLTAGFDGSLRFALIAFALMGPPLAVYLAGLDRYVSPNRRSYAVMACVAFSLVLMIGLVEFIGRDLSAESTGLYWHVLIVSAIDGGISMVAVLQFLLIEAESRESAKERRLIFGVGSRWLISPYPLVILVTLVISGSQELTAILARYETAGYLGSAHYLSSPPTGCDGKVLWIGERAVVITCGRDRLQHYAVVSTLNTPNMVICEFPFAGGPAGCPARPSSPGSAPPAPAKVAPAAPPTPPAAEGAAPRQASVEAASTIRQPRRRPRPAPEALESSAAPAGANGANPSAP